MKVHYILLVLNMSLFLACNGKDEKGDADSTNAPYTTDSEKSPTNGQTTKAGGGGGHTNDQSNPKGRGSFSDEQKLILRTELQSKMGASRSTNLLLAGAVSSKTLDLEAEDHSAVDAILQYVQEILSHP